MDIALIAIPLESTKKKADRILHCSASLNFGLLSIASYLANNGISTKVYDPQLEHENLQLKKCINWLKNNSPKAIALSCISGFSYPNFKKYLTEIRKHFPNITLIAGGQDHVGRLQDSIFNDCPELDVLTCGEGEVTTLAIIRSLKSKIPLTTLCKDFPIHLKMEGKIYSGSTTIPTVSQLSPLDYSLYYKANELPAAIEAARGCPFSCHFCSNIKRKYLKKPPRQIVNEAEQLVNFYNKKDLPIYLQTPIFNMSNDELIALADERHNKNLTFYWRAQTRVDTLDKTSLSLMKDAGAKVVDLGFESGSHEMLIAMNKTQKPSQYLHQASELLKAADELDIIIKLNILFYAGERRETLLETFNFLIQNETYVKAISAYPLLIYPGTNLKAVIAPLLEHHGGGIPKSAEWQDRRLSPVNASADYSYNELQEIGKLFGKSFQTIDSYLNERKYGYYKPNVNIKSIQSQLTASTIEHLPCSSTHEEMLINRQHLEKRLHMNTSRRNAI